MISLKLDDVFSINGRLVIRLQTFAKLLKYSDSYLLKLIKKLLKQGIKIAFKWRKNWYIYLPQGRTQSLQSVLKKQGGGGGGGGGDDSASDPAANEINADWGDAIDNLPPDVGDAITKYTFTVITYNGRLAIPVGATIGVYSSGLTPKNLVSFVPRNQGDFRATKEYKYGYVIVYDKNKMSQFKPGTGGSLKSTQKPQAFFEVCRLLDAAEKARNAANPGLPAKNNLSTTVSFDTGLIAVAATLPIVTSLLPDGTVKVLASDYIGTAYSTFDGGDGGDLSSTHVASSLLEIASILAAAEKAVTPEADRPNNVQVSFDTEAETATIAANIPFTTASDASGNVTIIAVDYL